MNDITFNGLVLNLWIIFVVMLYGLAGQLLQYYDLRDTEQGVVVLDQRTKKTETGLERVERVLNELGMD